MLECASGALTLWCPLRRALPHAPVRSYSAPFRDEVQSWSLKLSTVSEILEQWLMVQSNWQYMEAVFSGGDIVKQLPQEAKRFLNIDKNFMKIVSNALETQNVVNTCYGNELMKNMLPHLHEQLELCQKSLSAYLEQKRAEFPRFYFVSDPTLLEILSLGSDPPSVVPHFTSGLFDALANVTFDRVDKTRMTEMWSQQNEKVRPREPGCRLRRRAGRPGPRTAVLGARGEAEPVPAYCACLRATGGVRAARGRQGQHRGLAAAPGGRHAGQHQADHQARRAQRVGDAAGGLHLRPSRSGALRLAAQMPAQDPACVALAVLRVACSSWPRTLMHMASRCCVALPTCPQVSLLGIQFQWTAETQAALSNAKVDKTIMNKNMKRVDALLRDMVNITVRSDLTKNQRTNLETCITVHMHQKESTEDLVKKKIKDPTDFEWLKQVRGRPNHAACRSAAPVGAILGCW